MGKAIPDDIWIRPHSGDGAWHQRPETESDVRYVRHDRLACCWRLDYTTGQLVQDVPVTPDLVVCPVLPEGKPYMTEQGALVVDPATATWRTGDLVRAEHMPLRHAGDWAVTVTAAKRLAKIRNESKS